MIIRRHKSDETYSCAPSGQCIGHHTNMAADGQRQILHEEARGSVKRRACHVEKKSSRRLGLGNCDGRDAELGLVA